MKPRSKCYASQAVVVVALVGSDRCVATIADRFMPTIGRWFAAIRSAPASPHGKLPDELEVLWKYPAGKDAGFDATAVVADGVIYVGDSAGTFHAVRLADGKRVWTKEFADSGFAPAPQSKRDGIYVGDMNGIVRCLAARRQRNLESEARRRSLRGPDAQRRRRSVHLRSRHAHVAR